MTVLDEVRKELSQSNSIATIKGNLLKRGYLETDIDNALDGVINDASAEESHNNRLLSVKEFLDRIAYGFSSQQFVNILFALSGASLFFIGIINGLKTVFTYLLSGFIRAYSEMKYIGKTVISASGIIYGFSFLGMAFSVIIRSPWLFAISVLIATIGIIAHGDLYMMFVNEILKNEKRRNFLRFISYFGIIITAASMLLAAFIIDVVPLNGYTVSFDMSFLNMAEPLSFKIFGYLVAFEITAIMFVLSGYMMTKVKDKAGLFSGETSMLESFKLYFLEMKDSSKIFIKSPQIFVLTIATVITTVFNILGNSYYGIFIYENFRDDFLKGFTNVAAIFVIALIASIIASMLTKKVAKTLGEAPMIVFGTLLMALLPVTFYYNPHLYSIAVATALSVVGGSIAGVAQGIIAEKLMDDVELRKYYSSLGFFSIIPTLLLVTVGALVAQSMNLKSFFLIIAAVFVVLVVPLYLFLVYMADRDYRRRIMILEAQRQSMQPT